MDLNRDPVNIIHIDTCWVRIHDRQPSLSSLPLSEDYTS